MSLTDNQYDFALRLLKILGYTDESKINKLLNLYEKKYVSVEINQTTKSIKNRKGQHYKNINVYTKKIKNHSVDTLIWETDIRKRLTEIELINIDNNEYISATDLASFVFCNANYSISKSFIIKYSLHKKRIVEGSGLHEELRLLFKKKYFGFGEKYLTNYNDEQKKFLNKIKLCRLVFKGHEDESKVFINEEKKYKGQPDYVFLDTKNRYFVVEEKYHYQNSNEIIKYSEDKEYIGKDFFENNLIQLQSYIDYIKEFNIEYGVLINWYYYIDDGKIIVHDFTHKIIWKGKDYSQSLENTYQEILKFKNDKTIKFHNNINVNKCFNCSVNLYCAHKTDEFETLQIPYNRYHLNLKMNIK